ncbi:KN motif and ankyrin repeat domain-containing protein 4-like [Brachionichthys hirsutus]|uniref:KN motif and ankyrin repeat domain-containing protein 4-like n=1 Tax=Brachionichthys hirsutus TaxID=412623 RepID=UPI0036053B0E
MTEAHNGNTLPHKKTEYGVKGKPPYSVETPYGFRLDLDFLKYVDDIEKGNTIKRVPIHRRSKGTRSSTLPRHLNPSGWGHRPSPWASTGALGPRSRLSDTHPSRVNDPRSPLSPPGLNTLTEMEARIKEFDEQPLGEHIRPHLLRASSLPLTVLLRQGSESTDEPGSLRSSRDHLGGGNTSCEDVFYSPDSRRSQHGSELCRRLREAVERVSELEAEIKVIPELRAQICSLREEREQIRLGLSPRIPPPSWNGTTDSCTSSRYGAADNKRPRHESHVMFPRKHGFGREDSNPSHEWRTSTDLDELLTVTSLQAKVAALEQRLHETSLELQRTSEELKEQREESRKKDKKIEHLIRNPEVWVCAERATEDRDGDVTALSSTEPHAQSPTSPDGFVTGMTATTNGRRSPHKDFVAYPTERRPPGPADASDDGADTYAVAHHVGKIKSLLGQQWECLCEGQQPGEEGKPRQHPDPKVDSLQQEVMGLVDILSSYCTQNGGRDGEGTRHGASESITGTGGCTRVSEGPHAGGVNDGGDQREESESSSIHPREVADAQVGADPEARLTGGETIPGGAGSGRTDGDAESPEKTGEMKPQPSGEQMEDSCGSETTTGGREAASLDFTAACRFLNDHMDNMENPNEDTRKALIVLFKHWFSAAAEEASVASEFAVCLRDVMKATPSLLAFLVNMADGNGNTVLHYSVSHCNYSIVGLLLDTGVSDVNLQNNAGYTAVMLASLTAPDGPGGMEVVRKLMELGDIHVCSNQTGQTALHLAVRHGRVVMVRLLLSHGADANIQDSQGTTALMFASERGHTHIARLLLERSQCDLTLTDKRGRTALSIATQGSHAETATLLQAHAKARAS